MSEDIVTKLENACMGFVTGLRDDNKFDEDKYLVLCETLKECKKEWATSSHIPRLAVYILVDIHPVVLGYSQWYDEEISKRIKEAADNLYTLISDSVNCNI